MIDYREVQKWYADKLGRTVEEFDDYDNHVCKVAYDYTSEKEQLLLSRAKQMEKEQKFMVENIDSPYTESQAYILVGIQRIVKLIERHVARN